MAIRKISQLPAAGALDGTEIVPVVQSNTTKRATAEDIANAPGQDVPFAFDFGTSTLADGDTIAFIAPFALTLPASLSGSYCSAVTAATAETVLTIKRATTPSGASSAITNATFTIAAAGNDASLGANSETAISAGHRVEVVGPATADATAAGVRGVIMFTRA